MLSLFSFFFFFLEPRYNINIIINAQYQYHSARCTFFGRLFYYAFVCLLYLFRRKTCDRTPIIKHVLYHRRRPIELCIRGSFYKRLLNE